VQPAGNGTIPSNATYPYTIPVPLGYTAWNWSADAINTFARAENQGIPYLIWVINCPATPGGTNPRFTPGTGMGRFPVWTKTVQ
jgi:hypothetical protein